MFQKTTVYCAAIQLTNKMENKTNILKQLGFSPEFIALVNAEGFSHSIENNELFLSKSNDQYEIKSLDLSSFVVSTTNKPKHLVRNQK